MPTDKLNGLANIAIRLEEYHEDRNMRSSFPPSARLNNIPTASDNYFLPPEATGRATYPIRSLSGPVHYSQPQHSHPSYFPVTNTSAMVPPPGIPMPWTVAPAPSMQQARINHADGSSSTFYHNMHRVDMNPIALHMNNHPHFAGRLYPLAASGISQNLNPYLMSETAVPRGGVFTTMRHSRNYPVNHGAINVALLPRISRPMAAPTVSVPITTAVPEHIGSNSDLSRVVPRNVDPTTAAFAKDHSYKPPIAHALNEGSSAIQNQHLHAAMITDSSLQNSRGATHSLLYVSEPRRFSTSSESTPKVTDEDDDSIDDKSQLQRWEGMSPLLFNKRLLALQEFKSRYGHCNVPQNYIPNPALGRWCNAVRMAYNRSLKGETSTPKLSAFQWDQLKKIGFELYSGRNKSFRKRLEALKEFKRKYKHCRVPKRYREDPSLGAWCCEMRISLRKLQEGLKPRSILTPEMLEDLNEVGFVWNFIEADRPKFCSDGRPFPTSIKGHGSI